VDFVGLFALAKRKGLFQGEEIVKKQTTLNTNVQSLSLCSVEDDVDSSETRVTGEHEVLTYFCFFGVV
jgi:hypothetical protein